MEATTLATLLTSIGDVFTSIMGWVGDVAETVVTQPILLIGAVLSISTVGIRVFKSLK